MVSVKLKRTDERSFPDGYHPRSACGDERCVRLSARSITRPTDNDEQSATYSGKKKRHTVKNVLLAAATGTVPFLSDTYEGSRYDKPIADQTPYPLPEGSERGQDLGFVGFTLAGVLITQPHKKPRGQELTDEQKAENRVIARRRVLIEHIICSIKRCLSCERHHSPLEGYRTRYGDGRVLWLTQLPAPSVSMAISL
jgi:hypothetical protein